MRPPDIIRPVKLTTTLPEDVRAQLDIHLYSPLENRVPKGAYQAFFLERIREFFNTKTLDVGEFLDPPQLGFIVRGPALTISTLRQILEILRP